ncbi:unnamed protein product [Cylindrotheca closterium]|uniref:U4/U6.U5 small nuclear ribonucleoprotein 27kDa protein domain-containing protein n=1 Tax=Cylindrotheca closterium TaxID=2856 RepID=A0AAD2FYB2_9STRA|nr:unnamed protein product [Cylindrotheca closterium]
MSDHHRDHDDDVESYRSRKRRQEREGRESAPPPKAPKQKFANEREERMAKLRQELKEEDMELAAALDENIRRKEEEAKPKPQETIIEVHEEELEGLDEEDQMRMLMGIQGFGTTKGKEVKDNKNSAAKGVAAKNKARKYRQYMNRKNGFNRPLEKMD